MDYITYSQFFGSLAGETVVLNTNPQAVPYAGYASGTKVTVTEARPLSGGDDYCVDVQVYDEYGNPSCTDTVKPSHFVLEKDYDG